MQRESAAVSARGPWANLGGCRCSIDPDDGHFGVAFGCPTQPLDSQSQVFNKYVDGGRSEQSVDVFVLEPWKNMLTSHSLAGWLVLFLVTRTYQPVLRGRQATASSTSSKLGELLREDTFASEPCGSFLALRQVSLLRKVGFILLDGCWLGSSSAAPLAQALDDSTLPLREHNDEVPQPLSECCCSRGRKPASSNDAPSWWPIY